MENLSLLAIFGVAFLGSFSHCAFMCGGFISLFGTLNSSKNAFLLNLTYQISRITAYILLGSIFGGFGAVLVFSKEARATLFFVVGLILVFIGLALFFRSKILKFIENESISRAITAKIFSIKGKNKPINFAIFGFLNGLLPCGFVYYFLAQSILAGSFLNGALVMAVFGVATLPVMLFLGFFLKILGDKFRDFAFKIAILIVILNGIYLAFLGFMASG